MFRCLYIILRKCVITYAKITKCVNQFCTSAGDSQLSSVSSGWITSPSLSKFGDSYSPDLQTCPFSAGVSSLSRKSQFWGPENSPSSVPLYYNWICIAQGRRARTWGNPICWQSWPMLCQMVLPQDLWILSFGIGNEIIATSGRLHPSGPQNKRLYTPWTKDYRHNRQDRRIQTELAFTLANNATKPDPFEIISLQTTRKKNNWKTEKTLARTVVTLETERIKLVQSLMYIIIIIWEV